MVGGLPFEIARAIACEDIREEKSGKHTLVGVYSGDSILISAIPGNMAIAFFMEVRVKKTGAFNISIKLTGPGKHEAILKATLNLAQAEGVAIIASPRIDLLVDSEGTFLMDISTDEKDWVNVITRNISLNPSIAPQPPSGPPPTASPDSSSQPEPFRPVRGKKGNWL